MPKFRKISFTRLSQTLNKQFERPILISFMVLLGLALVVGALSWRYYVRDFENIYVQILAEAHGMLFDIAVIGILIFWLNKRAEKRLRIRACLDEIDDFRTWESEESAYRTAGNIKRLNRSHLHALDLAHCYLVRTNLDEVNLKEANLNLANLSYAKLNSAHFEQARLNQTAFVKAELNDAQLTNAYANGANFKQAEMIKADFENAFLIMADFEEAILMEANLRNADLSGANFKNTNLLKADLRGARGLSTTQLAEARTLYRALLDPEWQEALQGAFPTLLEKS
jgi:hypothetical protein